MRDAAARFWISIRALLSLILFIGVGIASLRGATAIWASVMILAALGAICTATVGAALIHGAARPEWLGFAVFGWAYFLLCLSPWGGEYGLGPARFLTRAANGLLLQIDAALVEMLVGGAGRIPRLHGDGKEPLFLSWGVPRPDDRALRVHRRRRQSHPGLSPIRR